MAAWRTVTTLERAFWDWFAANEGRLFAFERDEERTFDELFEQLQQVDPHLGFACGPVEQGRREFIITVDGRMEAFPAVTSLFHAAPVLAQWKVVAFRPRTCPLAAITFDGLTLQANDVFFTARPQQGLVRLGIYLPGQLSADRTAVMPFVCYMLNGILGEYDFATRIGIIDLRPASLAQDAGAQPLNELPQAVDALGSVAAMH